MPGPSSATTGPPERSTQPTSWSPAFCWRPGGGCGPATRGDPVHWPTPSARPTPRSTAMPDGCSSGSPPPASRSASEGPGPSCARRPASTGATGGGSSAGRWGALTGRFSPHRGHFDPGQRLANLAFVATLGTLIVSGVAMTTLSGGPTFATMVRIHRGATYVLTALVVGHVLLVSGLLPGYRGAWRAHAAGSRWPTRRSSRCGCATWCGSIRPVGRPGRAHRARRRAGQPPRAAQLRRARPRLPAHRWFVLGPAGRHARARRGGRVSDARHGPPAGRRDRPGGGDRCRRCCWWRTGPSAGRCRGTPTCRSCGGRSCSSRRGRCCAATGRCCPCWWWRHRSARRRTCPTSGLVAGLGAVVVASLAWSAWSARSARTDGGPEGDEGPPSTERPGRWAAVAAALLLVLWLPPIIDQVGEDPGNMSILVGQFSDDDIPAAGWRTATEVMLARLDPVELASGDGETTAGSALGLAFLAAWALAAGAAVARRDRLPSDLVRLHLVAGVAAALGVVSLSRVQGPMFPYLTLWSWGTAVVMAAATVWTAVALWTRARRREAGRRRPVVAAVAGVAAVAILAVATFAASGAEPPLPERTARDRALIPTALDALEAGTVPGFDDDDRYLVGAQDPSSGSLSSLTLLNEMDKRGFDARIAVGAAHAAGSHRCPRAGRRHRGRDARHRPGRRRPAGRSRGGRAGARRAQPRRRRRGRPPAGAARGAAGGGRRRRTPPSRSTETCSRCPSAESCPRGPRRSRAGCST